MTSQTIQGTLKPDGTVELAEKPQLPVGPVEITIRALPQVRPGGEDWWQCLQRARKELETMGYPFLNEGGVRAHIEDLRSGDERLDEVYRQVEAERRQEKQG
jgi:hypothetical protein